MSEGLLSPGITSVRHTGSSRPKFKTINPVSSAFEKQTELKHRVDIDGGPHMLFEVGFSFAVCKFVCYVDLKGISCVVYQKLSVLNA